MANIPPTKRPKIKKGTKNFKIKGLDSSTWIGGKGGGGTPAKGGLSGEGGISEGGGGSGWTGEKEGGSLGKGGGVVKEEGGGGGEDGCLGGEGKDSEKSAEAEEGGVITGKDWDGASFGSLGPVGGGIGGAVLSLGTVSPSPEFLSKLAICVII